MQDHGLFQAICRVNRLDSDDKEYGYIIDYKDLFKSLNQAVTDYTSEAFDGFDKEDVEGLLKDRLKTAREKLDNSRESIKALCEPVKPPKDTLAYIEYFCGDTENPDDLKNNEKRRLSLYKLTAKFVRSYANLANEMAEAGYTQQETEQIKKEAQNYENLRSEIKLPSGDYIELKAYEPAMRHLIDSYIDADESKTISAFDKMTIVDLIIKKGTGAVDDLPENVRKKKEAVAKTIENNVRRLIIEEKPTNPKYYEKMSVLLDELIRERKENAINYANYLKRIAELAKRVRDKSDAVSYPTSINTNAKRALYDNLESNEALALAINERILSSKQDGWRGNKIKERQVMIAVKKAVNEFGIDDGDEIERIFRLAKNQNEY
jgi:type I restriction enzyme R subunit